MKILIYSMHFWPEPTGIGKYTGEMAFWLSSKGHDVRVICSAPWYPFWKIQQPHSGWRFHTETAGGCSIRRCPIWVPRKPGGLTRILSLTSFALSSSISAIRSAFWKPDIVFSVEPPFFCLPAALLVATLTRARSWLHIQDFEVDAALKLGLFRVAGLGPPLRAFESWLFRRFDHRSTISEKMLELLRGRTGQPGTCSLFRNWVNTDTIFPLDRSSTYRSELGLRDHDVVALYAGNMGEKQGLETVVEAARLLHSRTDLVFVFCGDGAAGERIRTLADRLPNVRWLPVQPSDRLNDLLGLADIHLLPQRADAADLVMPSKLTGMLASGRPVIATAHPMTQVHDVVTKCGWTVAPNDPAALAEAIAGLASNREARKELGRQARLLAVSELGSEAILTDFLNSLLKLHFTTNPVTDNEL